MYLNLEDTLWWLRWRVNKTWYDVGVFRDGAWSNTGWESWMVYTQNESNNWDLNMEFFWKLWKGVQNREGKRRGSFLFFLFEGFCGSVGEARAWKFRVFYWNSNLKRSCSAMTVTCGGLAPNLHENFSLSSRKWMFCYVFIYVYVNTTFDELRIQ